MNAFFHWKKKIISVVLAVCLFWVFLPAVSLASDEDASGAGTIPGIMITKSGNFADFITTIFHIGREKTRIKGYQTDYQIPASSSLKETLTVTPGKKRTIRLQKYDTKEKAWNTVREVETDGKKTQKITLKFPESWNKTTYSTWRIQIPGTFTGTPYSGEKIHVTARNRSNVNISAETAVIMDMENGRVIYDKNMHERRPNASTTKVLTALIAEKKGDFNSDVVITKKAAQTGFAVFIFSKGDRFRFNDLYTAMLVQSSNESAEAIAENLAGDDNGFERLQTKELAALGCKDTHFVNPHGLDAENHYSSAYDQALIMKSVWKYPRFRKAVGTKIYPFREEKRHTLYKAKTTNELLQKNYKGMLGGKTGYTVNAKQAFVGVYRYKGTRYITVVMGSDHRFTDTKALYQYIRRYGR